MISLVEYIAEICKRPGMYLVAYGQPEINVSYLFLFITGFDAGLVRAGKPPEHPPFQEFVLSKRPQWRRSSAWYVHHLLDELGGDHWKASGVLLEWAQEFLASEPNNG